MTDMVPEERTGRSVSDLNKAQNLRIFRNFLHLSQSEFIKKYFTDENGKRLISVSKLSMAENGTVSDIDSLIARVESLAFIPREQFSLSSDKFSKYLFRFSGASPDQPEGMSRPQSYIESVVKMISDYLCNNIMYGKLHPGDKLPTEREMTKLFHIKRPILRDAIKVLIVLGLLEVRPGDGTYIANTCTDFYTIPLSWNLLLGDKAVEDIIRLRFLLDGEAAYMAAKTASPAEMMEINNVYMQMQAAFDAMDLKKYLDLDIEFHLAIAKASKSKVILNMLITMHRLMRNSSTGGVVHQNDIFRTHEAHTEILRAILGHSPEAARRALDAHCQEALDRFQRNQKAGFC